MNPEQAKRLQIHQRGKALEADLKKDEVNPITHEMMAGLIACLIFKEDWERRFQSREEALSVAKQLACVPRKKPTAEEIFELKKKASEKWVVDHITGVLLRSKSKNEEREELNLARILKIIGADPSSLDLGEADRQKVIRNFKKIDPETFGLLKKENLRILRNWTQAIDLKDQDGSSLNLPLENLNLQTAVRALGLVGWETQGKELQKAMDLYRKTTDRLGLKRKDKKCRSST